MTQFYSKAHDQAILLLKVAVYEVANKDKFISKRAWDKAYKDLDVNSWGSAEHWTDQQKDKLIEQASIYIPKKLTYENPLDMIKEVFDFEDVSHRLENK